MLKKKKAKKLSEHDKEDLFWTLYFFYDSAEDNSKHYYRSFKIRLKLSELGLLKEFDDFYEGERGKELERQLEEQEQEKFLKENEHLRLEEEVIR